jgi:hypothetical protein
MGNLLARLDEEWAQLAAESQLSATTSDVLALAGGAADWSEAQRWMRSTAVRPAEKDRVLRALAHRAALDADSTAARILLALLMPGIVSELGRHRSRPNARGMSCAELEAIVIETVWHLIHTYPTHRTGNVAANVLLDLRKHLCRRSTSITAELFDSTDRLDRVVRSDDNVSIDDVVVIVNDAVRSHRLAPDDAEIILDTRIRGIACKDAAARRSQSERTFRRRQRAAEARLAAHAREAFAA